MARSPRGRLRVHAAGRHAQGLRRTECLDHRTSAARPATGDVYIFVSRNRIRAKVLHWDGTGLCIYAKRLERGRFARLWPEEAGAAPVTLTVSELDLFLDGSTVVGRVPLSPPAVTQFSLASDRAR